MRVQLRYAFVAGLAIGLAAALVDAAILGSHHLRWLAFAFLVYGLGLALAEIVLALIVSTICGVLGRRPGPGFLAAFYLGLPAFALAAATGGEVARRYVIPAVLGGRHEFLTVLVASIFGLLAGGVFVAVLFWAARREGRSKSLSRVGWGIVGLACLSVAGLAVFEITYGLKRAEGKNVIIVSIDALRPDHLSCYGYDRPTSPNIDNLARGGARFERAICQSPGSTASHASILTSLYPLTHGAWNVGASLHEDINALQDHLGERGYVTAFFANNYFLQKRFGFGHGFHTFGNEGKVQQVRAAPLRSYPLSLGVVRFIHAWRTKPGEANDFTIDQALSWIDKNRKRKFFLFLHVMDPHAPYAPPAEYRSAFLRKTYDYDIKDGPKLRSRISSLSPEDKMQLVDLYDGDIAYADSKMGRLMERLRRWNLEEKTVVVITADHAEVLDEHGGLFNHGYLWDSCIRVPLIIHYPSAVPAGAVIDEIVESVDIVPTALGLIEEPGLPGAQGTDLTGLMNGEVDKAQGVAFTLGGITEGEGYSITTPRWKLSWIDEDHVELYDLLKDPEETVNLIDSEPDTAAALQRRLLTWVNESRKAAVVPRSETVALERLDRETRDRLRTLGYVD
jgi:arylsulfatase A-like enzyme